MHRKRRHDDIELLIAPRDVIHHVCMHPRCRMCPAEVCTGDFKGWSGEVNACVAAYTEAFECLDCHRAVAATKVQYGKFCVNRFKNTAKGGANFPVFHQVVLDDALVELPALEKRGDTRGRHDILDVVRHSVTRRCHPCRRYTTHFAYAH